MDVYSLCDDLDAKLEKYRLSVGEVFDEIKREIENYRLQCEYDRLPPIRLDGGGDDEGETTVPF